MTKDQIAGHIDILVERLLEMGAEMADMSALLGLLSTEVKALALEAPPPFPLPPPPDPIPDPPPPPPPVSTESFDKTVVSDIGKAIFNKAGNVFELNAERRIVVDGVVSQRRGGAGIIRLIYRRGIGPAEEGVVYQEDRPGSYWTVPVEDTWGFKLPGSPLDILDSIPAPTPTPTPVPTPQPPPYTGKRYFDDGSPWNYDLFVWGASPASNSREIISSIVGLGKLQRNTGAWTPMVYRVPGTATRVRARGGYEQWIPYNGQSLTNKGPGEWVMDGVPVMKGMMASADDDAHLVIICEADNAVYNFFRGKIITDAAGNPTGITNEGMGKFRLNGSGWWDPNGGAPHMIWGPWTGRSANSSMLAGLILVDELKAGEIPHAIAIGMDQGLMTQHPVQPALTSDGKGPFGNAVPNGTKLRLNPGLDISGAGREAQVVLRAMQRYGAIVCERSSGVPIYFENENGFAANPYASMDFRGLDASIWQHCIVLAPTGPGVKGYDHPAVWGVLPQPYPLH
jgi:hypothetical protein